jgi:hypothetical protein
MNPPVKPKKMKNLVENFETLAQEAAIKIQSCAVVKNWNNRRLYVNFDGVAKSAQDGGFVDIATGRCNYAYPKARTQWQKDSNAILDAIAKVIFEA